MKPCCRREKHRVPRSWCAASFRKVLDGILYVLQTGCQWKGLPKEFGPGSTCHKCFEQWPWAGALAKLWEKPLE